MQSKKWSWTLDGLSAAICLGACCVCAVSIPTEDDIVVLEKARPEEFSRGCPLNSIRGRYHGGRRQSSDDSFHSPTVIPPSALDKPSIMKRYHRRRTTRWRVTARSPTMVTLHDTRFAECRWWNNSCTAKTVVTWWSLASVIPAPGVGVAVHRSYPVSEGETLDTPFLQSSSIQLSDGLLLIRKSWL